MILYPACAKTSGNVQRALQHFTFFVAAKPALYLTAPRRLPVSIVSQWQERTVSQEARRLSAFRIRSPLVMPIGIGNWTRSGSRHIDRWQELRARHDGNKLCRSLRPRDAGQRATRVAPPKEQSPRLTHVKLTNPCRIHMSCRPTLAALVDG